MDSCFVGSMCGCKVNYTACKKSSGIVGQDRHLPVCELSGRVIVPLDPMAFSA